MNRTRQQAAAETRAIASTRRSTQNKHADNRTGDVYIEVKQQAALLINIETRASASTAARKTLVDITGRGYPCHQGRTSRRILGSLKSGKSITIASTEGNVTGKPGHEAIKIGLNVYRKKWGWGGTRGECGEGFPLTLYQPCASLQDSTPLFQVGTAVWMDDRRRSSQVLPRRL